jgi:hypothetical protein
VKFNFSKYFSGEILLVIIVYHTIEHTDLFEEAEVASIASGPKKGAW